MDEEGVQYNHVHNYLFVMIDVLGFETVSDIFKNLDIIYKLIYDVLIKMFSIFYLTIIKGTLCLKSPNSKEIK